MRKEIQKAIGWLLAVAGYLLWMVNPHSFIWIYGMTYLPFSVGVIGVMEGFTYLPDPTKKKRGILYVFLGEIVLLSSAYTTGIIAKFLNYPLDWVLIGGIVMTVALYLLWLGIGLVFPRKEGAQ